jgi:hypothetical protein
MQLVKPCWKEVRSKLFIYILPLCEFRPDDRCCEIAGEVIYSVVFIVSGCVCLDDTPDGAISLRPSFSEFLRSLPQTASRSVLACYRKALLRWYPVVQSPSKQPTPRNLFAGDWFGPGVRGAEDVDATVWNVSERVVVSGLGPCVTVEIPWKVSSRLLDTEWEGEAGVIETF